MTIRERLYATLLSLPVFLLGCASPTGDAGPATLESALKVTALGVRSPSDVMVHQQGSLDPGGHDLRVEVIDVQGTLRTPTAAHQPLVVESLTLSLADVDLPATQQMPDGMHLRDQYLIAPAPIEAPLDSRGPNGVGGSTAAALEYHTAMLLADGTHWPLGKTEMASDRLQVQIARTGQGVTITLDSAAGGACGTLGQLLSLSNCSLYVEADGSLSPSE
jgi:hypothetical protein